MKQLMILLVLGVIAIAGCQNVPGGDTAGPFRGGVDGVAISFVEAAPPSTFNQNEDVPIRVLLANNGEFDVPVGEGKVKMFGIHHSSYSLNSDYVSTPGVLRGTSQFSEEGGEVRVEMGNLKYIPEVSNFFDATLKAKVCYPYQTEAQVSACISSVQIEESGVDLDCDTSGDKIGDGDVSSGPVQVTSVMEEFRGANQILLNVKVENKGVGDVFDSTGACVDFDDAVKRVDFKNVIQVDVLGEGVTCSFADGVDGQSGQIRLRDSDGIKEFTCWKNVESGEGNFEQKVTFVLGYKYVDDVTKAVQIFETVS